MTVRKSLYFTTAVAALSACAGLAHAQSTALQEVIITAERVESTVQRTALAIATVEGAAIDRLGVSDAKDLNKLVPGLRIIQSGSGGSSFYIRGVGNANANAYNDNGLAVSLDQTYFSRPYGPDMALYDLERVEVLKGPQGTLYGRNATGGAINFVTRKPVLGEYGGDAGVEVGSYDLVKLNGAINLPLGESLAARLAFQTVTREGYFDDGYNDADTQSMRAHLLWQPTDTLSVLLSGNYMHDGGKGVGLTPYENHAFQTGDPWAGGGSPAGTAFTRSRAGSGPSALNTGYPASSSPAIGGVFTAPGGSLPGALPTGFVRPGAGPYLVYPDGFTDITVWDLKADIRWNLGWATLTLLPVYLKTEDAHKWYNGPTAIQQYQDAEQTSFEARLNGEAGRLKWIAGYFYQDEEQDYTFYGQSTGTNVALRNRQPEVTDESHAVFAQGSFSATDTLRFTAGVRHTREEKASLNASNEGLGVVLAFVPPPFGAGAVAPGAFFVRSNTAVDFEATNYRLGVEWDVTPANLLYATVSTGFHAGGIQNGGPVTRPLCVVPAVNVTPANFAGCDLPASYEPEELTAYAIGTKNRFFDNRVQLNAEAYYWDYKDLQISHLGVINPSTTGFRVSNAGSATIMGVDADLSWLVTDRGLFTASVNYAQSEYDELLFYAVVAGRSVTVNNLNGRPFLGAPDLTASLSYQHIFDMPWGGTLVPGARANYSSKVIYGYRPAGQLTDVYQDAYWRGDLDLTYNAPGDRWSLTAYIRNVSDEAIVTSGGGNTPATNSPWVSVAPPRTFGMVLKARFGGS